MSLRVLFLLILWIFPASLTAQSGGITHVDTIPAPSLRNNLFGDPDTRLATVYLPPGYSKGAKRYAVVYLLHGFAADHRAFMKGAYQNLNVRISMDSLIRAGLAREMIVVTPNARSFFDGSFYANSSVSGNWEDFIVRDLVRYMDRRYRTIRKSTGRGIAGHSMGGYGAFRIGMRNPDTFSAIYMMSACCLSSIDSLEQLGSAAWKKAVMVKDTGEFRRAGFIPNIIYGIAGVYSPNPSNPPLFVDLPLRLDADSLVRVPSVAERWRVTPFSLAPRHAQNLRRMHIAFDAGAGDGFRDIPANVHRLDSLLTSLGIPHEAEVYEGTHGNRIRHRLESKVFPFFSRVLH